MAQDFNTSQDNLTALSAGDVEYADCISAEGQYPLPITNEYPGYDTKLHLMVRLKS